MSDKKLARVPSSGTRASRFTGRLRRDRGGSLVIEFALLIPLMFALSIGILEFALVGLDYHRAGEATRRAARQAAILPPIANLTALAPGGQVICRSTGAGPTCTGGALETAGSFAAIVSDMQAMLPAIGPENVEVIYSLSGLGDATTPGGILPLVQINLTGVDHPYSVIDKLIPGLPASLTLPAFSTTQLAGGYQPV